MTEPMKPMERVLSTKPICECCKRQADSVRERNVATKKAILNICKKCEKKYINYPPETFMTPEKAAKL